MATPSEGRFVDARRRARGLADASPLGGHAARRASARVVAPRSERRGASRRFALGCRSRRPRALASRRARSRATASSASRRAARREATRGQRWPSDREPNVERRSALLPAQPIRRPSPGAAATACARGQHGLGHALMSCSRSTGRRWRDVAVHQLGEEVVLARQVAEPRAQRVGLGALRRRRAAPSARRESAACRGPRGAGARCRRR